MGRVIATAMMVMMLASVVQAQVIGTPQSRWGWDLVGDGDRTDLSFEISIDNQPYAPILGVSCDAGGACSGEMTAGLPVGTRTARMRSWKVISGVRRESAPTPPLDQPAYSFIYVGEDLTPPQNFRLIPPPGAVAVNGTVSAPPYGFAGLEVAPVSLDGGGQLMIAAARLSVPGYTVRQGDRMGLVMVPR